MAVRRLTYSYSSLEQFLADYSETLVHGGLMVPADAVEGELANAFRLDLVLPMVGRVGPIRAQVVHRAPDGSVGLSLPDFQAEAGEALTRLFGFVDEVRAWLIQSGEVVERSVVEDQLRQSAAALEASALEASAAGSSAAGSSALEASAAGSSAAGSSAAGSSAAEAAAVGAAASPVSAPVAPGAPAAPASRPARGFAVPDVGDAPPALSGSMGDRSFRDAIIQIALERVTGLMTVRYPDGRVRYGFWHKGGPVGWRTDPLQEQEVLGVLLFKAKQITKEQIAQSLQIMQSSGIRQGEALMEMGVLSFPQLIMVLGKQVEYLLRRTMQERDASWSFHVLDELPEKFLPPALKVPALLYKSLVAQGLEMRGGQLADALRPLVDRYVLISDDVLEALNEVKLSPDERKFVEVAQSSSFRLRELYSVSPMSRRVTAATVWAFNELGFFNYQDTEDRGRYLHRVGTRIKRKRAHMSKGTHFDALEIHWICLPQEIEEAYRRLKAEFNPASYKDLPDDLLRDLEVIHQHLDEAHAALRSEAGRREYRKGIIEWFMIVQSAELLAKKGEMAIMRQDGPEACGCFAKALELNPGRPEFREGLARATAIG